MSEPVRRCRQGLDLDAPERECLGCEQIKPKDAFYRSSPHRCKRCRRLEHVMRCYGQHAVEMVQAFDGRCQVCSSEDPNGRNWHVDHDHETGLARGILCSKCNSGLGLFDDDPARLEEAARYLRDRTVEV